MVSSYVRIRCSVEDGMARYDRWIGAAEVRPARLVPERDAVDLALADGDWIGLAVFIYGSGPWTVIEELSGGLALRSAESWLELAEGGDLVYAGYNDTVPYAQIIMVEGWCGSSCRTSRIRALTSMWGAAGGSEAAASGLDGCDGIG
jgi:hypothetical protein